MYETVKTVEKAPAPFDASQARITPFGGTFGARVEGLDLALLLPEPPASFGAWLRDTLDTFAVLHFVQMRSLDAKQVVALHALFEHEVGFYILATGEPRLVAPDTPVADGGSTCTLDPRVSYSASAYSRARQRATQFRNAHFTGSRLLTVDVEISKQQ